MSRAAERRRVFSSRRDRRSSIWVGREGSKAGEAMGESSVVMVKRPSKGLSGRGAVTWAEIWMCTLHEFQKIVRCLGIERIEIRRRLIERRECKPRLP